MNLPHFVDAGREGLILEVASPKPIAPAKAPRQVELVSHALRNKTVNK